MNESARETRRPEIGIPAAGYAVDEHPDERFFATVVENLPYMVFVKDAEQLCFVRFNRAGEELLGYPREEMIGKNDYDLFPLDEADFFTRKDREVLAGGRVVDIREEPIHTRYRGTRILHTKKIPIMDACGRPLYLLGISEDITERKIEERRLEKLNQTLRSQSQLLQNLVDESQSFSYAVSHDLRAPLRTIDGFCHVLLEDHAGCLDENGRDSLRRIRCAAQRMGSLMDGLLMLSRLTGKELRRENLDWTALASRISDEIADQRGRTRGCVTVTAGMTASGDPLLLQPLLRNLLDNAFKFTAGIDSPSIEVGVESGASGVVYYVRDNGIGFDPAYATRLFRAFERLENAAGFDGCGIGLATVERVVHRHGGQVWAVGSPGHGATVYFTLP